MSTYDKMFVFVDEMLCLASDMMKNGLTVNEDAFGIWSEVREILRLPADCVDEALNDFVIALEHEVENERALLIAKEIRRRIGF